MPGRFVTFEGGEGAGKSTQVAAVADLARAQGIEVVSCREPGGTVLGERLREALFGLDDAPSATAELLTFEAARAELVATVIRPALERGALVLCDRFTDSTLAYQGYGRGLDLAMIEAINMAATGGLVPDLTMLLDQPPEVGTARRAKHTDYVERESVAFHQRIRDGFLALAAAQPSHWVVLDEQQAPEVLTRAIWERVQTLISL